ncbi:MAG: hypothetical protein AAGD06_22115 [Acidobacteriota bacterium]
MLQILLFALLTALAVAMLVVPDLTYRLAGFSPLGEPDAESLDAGWTADERDAPRLLAERNRVEVEVPRDMTVGAFLDLYQIRMGHVRSQIAQQLGVEAAPDDTPLPAGTPLTLSLTPGSRPASVPSPGDGGEGARP